MSDYKITPQKVPTFYFMGVTTAKSSIMRVFPLWASALDRPDVVIKGLDLKIHDEPAAYRQAVAQIKYDPLSLGGLVTTHKIDLLNAARDLFEYLDPYAQLCGELSSISKCHKQLEGHAKDPISSGLSLEAMLGDNYFGRSGGEVLCFGAGGSAVAIALHLINKPNPDDRPRRFVVVNRSPARLDHLRAMVESQQTDIRFEYLLNQDARRNDDLMAGMPASSLIINATGMGKDTPGSPLTNAGLFPPNSIAWELNYRGELDFMQQALAQVHSRSLTVEDGWLYFLHGWTQVIAQVFHMPIEGELFEHLAQIAGEVRQ